MLFGTRFILILLKMGGKDNALGNFIMWPLGIICYWSGGIFYLVF